MAGMTGGTWSEKYRQAAVVLGTVWGLGAAIVLVLGIYAVQRDAAIDAVVVPPPQPIGPSEIWLAVPALPQAASGIAADVAPDPVPVVVAPEPAPQPIIEEPVPEPVAVQPVAPAPIVAAPAASAPAPAPIEEPAQPAPIIDPQDVFVVVLGGGEDFGLLNALPANTAIVLGVIDDNTPNFVSAAQARNIQILLPLPVAAQGPLPSLAAEPDENRRRFGAFLEGLPPIDGLYVPAGHPFNKDMASFAALLEEAKARGLYVVGTIPKNLQTPTNPLPLHRTPDGDMVASDASNLVGVFSVFAAGREGLTVLTAPADIAFARALAKFLASAPAYQLTVPEGF